MHNRNLTFSLFTCLIAAASAGAQDRLKSMPGYDQFVKMSALRAGAVKSGQVTGTWADNGKAFDYVLDGKRMRFDAVTGKVGDAPPSTADATNAAGNRLGAGRERGRQFTEAVSPDGKRKAVYKDRNLFLTDSAGNNPIPITTDGSEKERIKYGTASWVYGEELNQSSAIWWNPAGTKVAYYRFNEKPVPDFFLQMDQTKLQSSLDVEAYPKAGVDNPIVDLFVYDVATGKSTTLDIRDGRPFTNDVVGHYVYNVRWSPDGKELLVNRTNRRQNIMEFAACSPETAKCRAVIREEWPTGWVENNPPMTWLADKNRFLWLSERNGFKNFYLYDLSGKLITPVTQHQFEVVSIVKVDEAAGVLWYTARDGENHLKVQLHRIGLNGTDDVRLTDPAYMHSISLAPDGRHFVDVAQAHDVAPFTRILDAKGKVVVELAKSDLSKFEQAGFKKQEMFTYLAADGKTTLHGLISFPSTFVPTRRYPVLMSVYGGPEFPATSEFFQMPSPTAEYGFICVSLDSRSAGGIGKRVLDAIYLKLGQVEMDDMAEGLKALATRPYVDGQRMGIYGTSYGGYSSDMMLLRHPEVIAAASGASAVTAWNHYDTIYTERYMWIPQENAEGYRLGSVMTYADKLKGRLMIYYGTADNNVHPNNAMQLIKALQQAGKSFEVQVGPDQGHSGVNNQRMMEFFIENLVLGKPIS
ncbi:MAG: peptidase dipeptidylpeptidase domain protein [Gemmatimonadetes bacterium]|nr:peptidase dipeptidylpeptidase domain protein [Gemmatimonadota bacterium]